MVETVALARAAGAVTDTGGAPVTGAIVTWTICQAPGPMEGSDTTDAGGAYHLRMTLFPSSGDILCVLLVAEPPAGAALTSDTVRVEGLVFSGADRVAGDSVTVDFRLGNTP